MRAALAMGLLIVLCTTVNAAPAHRVRAHHPSYSEIDGYPAGARPGAEADPRARFAVPGWSDEATQRWLNSASSNVGRGG